MCETAHTFNSRATAIVMSSGAYNEDIFAGRRMKAMKLLICMCTENQPEITLFGDDDDEEIISTDCHGGSTEENKLDEAMGVLQDVLIDPEFVQLQSDFCQKHCGKTTNHRHC